MPTARSTVAATSSTRPEDAGGPSSSATPAATTGTGASASGPRASSTAASARSRPIDPRLVSATAVPRGTASAVASEAAAYEAPSAVTASTGERWASVDVDASEALQQEFGELVPVVLVDGVARGHWRLQTEPILAALRG